MINIAMIEDDDKDALLLKQAIESFGKKENQILRITRFTSGEAFLTNYRPVYDLVFLDVELPGMNGMMTAEKFRSYDQSTILIFITHVAALAIKGYQYNAMDYMLKPVSEEDIYIRMKKIASKLKSDDLSISIPIENGIKLIQLGSLYYVESFGHILIYHTAEGNYKVREKTSMKLLEEKLSLHSFSRCSVSYLVNLRLLSSVDGSEVIMMNGDHLPISRNRKKEFVDSFFKTIQNTGGIL
mgnify:CR=1 FL=1